MLHVFRDSQGLRFPVSNSYNHCWRPSARDQYSAKKKEKKKQDKVDKDQD